MDTSAILGAVNFQTAASAIVLIFAALAGVLVVLTGGQLLLSAIGGDDGDDDDDDDDGEDGEDRDEYGLTRDDYDEAAATQFGAEDRGYFEDGESVDDFYSRYGGSVYLDHEL